MRERIIGTIMAELSPRALLHRHNPVGWRDNFWIQLMEVDRH